MNVLILAAGSSESFETAGYSYPKNLVEVDEKPLIQRVRENLASLDRLGSRFTFVIRKDEAGKFHTDRVIKLLDPNAQVILSPANTSGAACTALLAGACIDNADPLLIVNGDQLLDVDHAGFIEGFVARKLDGGIPVFDDVHPRYSFVKLGEDGLVVEAAEKRPISNLATAGRYWFREGRAFVRAAMAMILKDAHVEGSFYICPAYNEMVLAGAKIGVERVERRTYHNLANPVGLQDYLKILSAPTNP